MIKDISGWMTSLVQKLSAVFNRRVIFIGLQGSYARGEATEQSDIDVVFILDELTINDMATYKDIVRTMPFSEKACGFICGKQEVLAWAKSDLLQLVYDTVPYSGDLNALVGPIDRRCWIDAVKIGVGNIYHEICHRFTFDGTASEQVEELKIAYKAVFFILRMCVFLETGKYIAKRDELQEHLSDTDRQMLRVNSNWPLLKSDREERPGFYFEQLLNWCRKKLIQYE